MTTHTGEPIGLTSEPRGLIRQIHQDWFDTEWVFLIGIDLFNTLSERWFGMAFHAKGIDFVHFLTGMGVFDRIFDGFGKKGQVFGSMGTVTHETILVSLSGKGRAQPKSQKDRKTQNQIGDENRDHSQSHSL